MNKIFKWAFIAIGGLISVLILAVILIPLFVDIQQYKPQIEQEVTKATGHPFTLGGDLKLSLFPWVGIAITDMHFGNPAGFSEKDMVVVKEFRVKVKVLPLLSKRIEVKEFVLNGARAVLETRKDGRTGWQDLLKTDESSQPPQATPESQDASKKGGLPINDLQVAEFAITDCSLLWLDQKNDVRKEVSGLKLTLTNLSFDKPIGLDLAVVADNYPLAVNGKIGPVGKDLGKGTIPLDLALSIIDQLKLTLKGVVKQPTVDPAFDLTLALEEFSPRSLLEALKQPLPFEPSDPAVLTKVGFSLQAAGGSKSISLSNGKVRLDDSNLTFSAAVKEFSKPNAAFELKLDQIDLDRYLPAPAESEATEETATQTEKTSAEKSPTKIDYTPLRKLVLDGKVSVDHLKVKNAKVQNVLLKVTALNGILKLDPFSMDLYQGQTKVVASVNVQKESPKTDFSFTMNAVRAGALVGDVLGKDLIEGNLASNVTLTLTGDTPDQIKKTISGNGALNFRDGALKGIDLAGMVNNAAAAFGLVKKGQEAPKTEFTELAVPFTMTQGLFETRQTRLQSTVLQLAAAGKANLVTETLNFRVEPKFVSPIAGQNRRGILVPVVVTGTFEKPKFKPDLKAALKQNLGVDVDQEAEKIKKRAEQEIQKEIQKKINKQLPGKISDQDLEKTKEKIEKEAKKLFKGLPFSK